MNNPGTYKILNSKSNILYALSLASDMTEFANRKKVKIIRNENGVNKVFFLDCITQDLWRLANTVVYHKWKLKKIRTEIAPKRHFPAASTP